MSRLKQIRWKYIALFGVALLVFIYLRFPYGALRDQIAFGLQRSIPGSEVKIKGVRGTLLPGIKVGKLGIFHPDSEQPLIIENIRIRLHVLPLILLKTSIGVSGDMAGGSFSTRVSSGRGNAAVTLKFNKINLDALLIKSFVGSTLEKKLKKSVTRGNPAMAGFLGSAKLRIRGLLSGKVSLSGDKMALQKFDLTQIKAGLWLEGSGMKINEIIPGGLDLDKLEVDASADKGKAELKTIRLQGKDANLTAIGKMNIGKRARESNIDLNVDLAIPDKANKVMKGSVSLALAPLGVKLRPNGTAKFKVSGTLGRPPRVTQTR